MRLTITILYLILLESCIFAQQEGEKDKEIFFIVEDMPSFQGQGTDGARRYITENLVYPEYAYKRDIKGRVYLQFTVDSKGQVRDVFVVKGEHISVDYAAYKVIENMPRWTSGKARGRSNPVSFTFPVIFDPEKTDPQQISNVYDKQIEYLLTLDSLQLDSLLYKKKTTVWQEERVRQINDSLNQVKYLNKDTITHKPLSTYVKSIEEKKDSNSISEIPIKDMAENCWQSDTISGSGYSIFGKLNLEGYLRCAYADYNYNYIDIIFMDSLVTHPNKEGCYSFHNITDSTKSHMVAFSYNKDTVYTTLGYECNYVDFTICLLPASNNLYLPEVYPLNIRPLTSFDKFWDASLANRFKNRKKQKIEKIVFYIPRLLKDVFIYKLVRNKHFTYKLWDVKAVHKTVKTDNDLGYEYILDGRYYIYYNTGELKVKGKTRMGECVGLWKVYNKKRKVIATYDFTGDKTIYRWIHKK